MSAGSTRRSLGKVLVAGDQEADLRLLRLEGDYAVRTTQGVRLAVSALREDEFAVVVGDVAAVDDAMAILRAAARGRPPARSIVLLPADFPEVSPGAALIRASAFATLRHPIEDGVLERIVAEAAADYQSERTAPVVQWRGRTVSEERRWREAERALADALRTTVLECSGFQRSTADGVGHLDRLVEGVAAAVVEAVQSRQADPAVLSTIAGALIGGVRSGARHGEAA